MAGWRSPIACRRSPPSSAARALDDERAAELAREAAELSAEAVEEANRRMREAE